MLIQLIEQVNVPAKVTGVLVDVVVHEGRIVKEGDLLAQVMDTEARLAEARAKAEVDIARMNAENDISVRFAKKSAEVAQADLRRALASIERYPKSVPESELDRLRLMVERAVLEVEQAGRDFEIAGHTQRVKESLYELARYQVEQRRITAPLGGVVVQVNRFRGEWVEPGDTVVRILRVDRVRAEGFLKLPDVRRDLQGQPITLTVDLPDEVGAKFPGKIVFLSPEIDPVNAQIRVWAEVENRGLRLRPGMRAKMTIEPSSPDRMGKE
jgi:macrolide-specific efflux system membrane fusion protein